MTIATTAASEAKVLRDKGNSPTVLIFKDAEALSRFSKLAVAASQNESAVGPLLSCRAPQGSKVDVLGSGYRTAFVRVVDGIAAGCEGTVSLGTLKDQ
ncbi:hypothetical protein [Bradyrhizobium sp. Ec3.3]|nr:hypothetical protein [Bradyrhizobium sp. Ec3.3]